MTQPLATSTLTLEHEPVRAVSALQVATKSPSLPPQRILWGYVFGVALYHLLALLALVPWLFNWMSVIGCVACLYVFGTLGVNVCFHRLLTHRSFECPLWFEHFLAMLGVCCLQDTPARWVAIHRMHHQHSDEDPDPHSPIVNFLWAHMGWLFVSEGKSEWLTQYERYARDILQDRFYLRMERHHLWIWINLLQIVVVAFVGLLLGYAVTRTLEGGVQQALSMIVWCVFVRTVLIWHITWSVNSISHLWGYRSFETGENSRNNWLVALVSNGEGWHNNHHADQRSAAHGMRWWELDVTYWTIRAFATVGLARNVIVPNRRLLHRHSTPLH